MKKIVFIFFILLILTLTSCGFIDNNNTNAELSNNFLMVSKNEYDKGNIYVLKYKDTGCYFTYTTSIYTDAFAPDVEQIYIEKNGVAIPYCEK